MAYEKTYDLLNLAIWMQSNREGVSLQDITERFQVSRRTAERMRDMIVAHFPQTEEVIGENNTKYWYIPQGTLKDFIQFSAEELSVLNTAKQLLKKHKLEDKVEIFNNIENKIKASIKQDVRRRIEPDAEAILEAEGFICHPGPKIQINPEVMENLKKAIIAIKRVRIHYFNHRSGKVSSNTLDPYGFLYGERNHYLIAHHSDGYAGEEVRNFSLSQIQSVEILDEPTYFVKGFNLENYVLESFGAFHEEPFEVEWLFDQEVAQDASKYIFHPKQTSTLNPDGTLTVRFKAGGAKEMDWHLYTWGNHVTVIKPENWKERIK